MPSSSHDLLRRLGSQDEACLHDLMVPIPGPALADSADEPRLDARTWGLVRLAALFAIGAPTPCLRWALELACGAGVDDGEVVATLLTAASAEACARLQDGAGPLVIALGY